MARPAVFTGLGGLGFILSAAIIAADQATKTLFLNLGLLEGKPFVSEAGGTWGRSRMMMDDLGKQFSFTSTTNGGLEHFSAANGQMEFLLKENPEHKIFHTVQVEQNGFIHALLSGTPDASKGYEYFGERAYTNWIR